MRIRTTPEAERFGKNTTYMISRNKPGRDVLGHMLNVFEVVAFVGSDGDIFALDRR